MKVNTKLVVSAKVALQYIKWIVDNFQFYLKLNWIFDLRHIPVPVGIKIDVFPWPANSKLHRMWFVEGQASLCVFCIVISTDIKQLVSIELQAKFGFLVLFSFKLHRQAAQGIKWCSKAQVHGSHWVSEDKFWGDLGCCTKYEKMLWIILLKTTITFMQNLGYVINIFPPF